MLVEMSVNSSAGLIDTAPGCESEFEPQPATRMTRTRIDAQRVRKAFVSRIIVSPLFLALWKKCFVPNRPAYAHVLAASAEHGSGSELSPVYARAALIVSAPAVAVMVLILISGSLLSSFMAPSSTPKCTDLK